MRTFLNCLILFLLLLSLGACKVYKQNILFKTDQEIIAFAETAQNNYVIQANDYVQFMIYVNKGELLVDPAVPGLAGIGAPAGAGQQGGGAQTGGGMRYLIQYDGTADLPLIGKTALAGYTLHQADSLLANLYAGFYKEVFVRTAYLNKRVIVLKGSSGMVIPLDNEDMTLIEIVARAGGIGNSERAGNIKLIRGDLSNPNVYIIDLTTMEGVKRTSLKMAPGDIVYIEPIRKTLIEAIGDAAPVLGFLTTILTLTILLIR